MSFPKTCVMWVIPIWSKLFCNISCKILNRTYLSFIHISFFSIFWLQSSLVSSSSIKSQFFRWKNWGRENWNKARNFTLNLRPPQASILSQDSPVCYWELQHSLSCGHTEQRNLENSLLAFDKASNISALPSACQLLHGDHNIVQLHAQLPGSPGFWLCRK